ncbi:MULTISPECIES: sensor histidine kinase [unclassified Sphingomonas]|uniref:sensor histidine kinase n=1 Tax=Novosphingobium rhizosphaerae TaxID=1551649 RepID=UPI0015CC9657
MKLVPRSLYGRLLGSAVLFITIALVIAGLLIGRVLERFVMHGLDDRLDAQIALLARAVRPDGTVDAARAIDVPPFDQPGSGWAWQVRAPHQTLRSASLGGNAMPAPLLQPVQHRGVDHGPIHPADGMAASGEPLHFRIAERGTIAGPVTITASGPREVAERPLRQAIAPLLASLLILGMVLIASIVLQLRFGLRPLRGLEASLAAVRCGVLRHVPADQPLELRPLVTELNALIDQNEAGLDNARRHVANLAHGLKTPLAALRVRLDQEDADPKSASRVLVDRMDASIRHHLGRARAAAPGKPMRQATPLGVHVTDLVETLARIHGDRTVTAKMTIGPAMSVACDPQDLDEMLGNLLDNAWRWAAQTVWIDARAAGSAIEIVIADDGPGLTEAAQAEALVAGRRLDERGDGHGFGLSITRELAELYGGSLSLGTADAGGLAAKLCLPRAAD